MDEPVRISVNVQEDGKLRQFKVEEPTFEAAVVAVLRMLTKPRTPVVGEAV